MFWEVMGNQKKGTENPRVRSSILRLGTKTTQQEEGVSQHHG